MNMRKFYKFIIPTLFLAFNVCLVLFPGPVLESAQDGLLLWFNRVLPSLLPFAVGVNVLTRLGVIKKLGGYMSPVMEPLFNLPGAAGAALLTGLTSGYPMGAKTAADLRGEKLLNSDEAQRLAGFCNNAGPLFIVGLVGTSLFGGAALGYKLLTAHIISALALGIGLGFTSGRRRKIFRTDPAEFSAAVSQTKRCKNSCGKKPESLLGGSVRDAMEAMTLVGGLIIFFSVLTRLLDVTGIVRGLPGGLLEVTNGVRAAAAAEGLDLKMKLALAAGFISFGGLSVHAQAVHFLSGEKIKTGHYLICKIIHGLLAAIIMLLI